MLLNSGCWRRRLSSPWTARSSQSILREINPEYSLEGLMLKLKLQYFGQLMYTDDSPEKTLKLGKIEGRGEEGVRGWDSWMASPMQWTWTWANFRDGEGQGGLACCNTWGLKESDMTGQLNKILITEHRFICFWLITGTVNIFGSVSKFFLCYIEWLYYERSICS